ncbi:unnamed protein product [Malus baccata var. baccata]
MSITIIRYIILVIAKFPSDHVAASARPLGGIMKPKTFGPKTAFLPQATGPVPPTGSPNPCTPRAGRVNGHCNQI